MQEIAVVAGKSESTVTRVYKHFKRWIFLFSGYSFQNKTVRTIKCSPTKLGRIPKEKFTILKKK